MADKKKLTEEDNDLLAALGLEVEVKQAVKYTALEQRVITGFEEIQKFVEEEGRLPQSGEDKDIFERIYAVRLERIRLLDESQHLLADLDHQNLLEGYDNADTQISDDLDDDELLAQLGVEPNDETSITKLKHVPVSYTHLTLPTICSV